jgi:uncharacterized protein (UPF0548 family)
VPRFSPVDEAAALAGLRDRLVNYDPAHAPQDGRADGHWHVDSGDILLGREEPGPPAQRGIWDSGCLLVRQYEFAEPRILRAAYRPGDELLGRDMLLEGRFFGLRFYLGVRVTAVLDETREGDAGPERVWGWSYQTLQGHLEEGRLTYEVIKNLTTGRVIFRVSGYSRAAPIPNPVVRWGFRLFGRWTQRRFYAAAQQRLRRLIRAGQRGAALPVPAVRADGIALAPTGSTAHPLERAAKSFLHPGASGHLFFL